MPAHFLTEGIDSGSILFSRRVTDIVSSDNEATLDCKVIKPGVDVVAEAVKNFLDDNLKVFPQWERGRVFNYRDFTPRKRLELEKKLKKGLVARWLERNRHSSFEHVRTVGDF